MKIIRKDVPQEQTIPRDTGNHRVGNGLLSNIAPNECENITNMYNYLSPYTCSQDGDSSRCYSIRSWVLWIF